MFATRNPALGSIPAGTTRSTPPSSTSLQSKIFNNIDWNILALERTTRANSVTYRSAQKHADNNDEASANRQGKVDLHDFVTGKNIS